MQWLSPAFPLGAFAYAHGLEQVVADGAVSGACDLSDWLAAILRDGAGLADASLLAAAMNGRDAAELDALARALAPSRQRWAETAEQGAAFARTLTAMGTPLPEVALPVALGVAARGLGAAARDRGGAFPAILRGQPGQRRTTVDAAGPVAGATGAGGACAGDPRGCRPGLPHPAGRGRHLGLCGGPCGDAPRNLGTPDLQDMTR